MFMGWEVISDYSVMDLFFVRLPLIAVALCSTIWPLIKSTAL